MRRMRTGPGASCVFVVAFAVAGLLGAVRADQDLRAQSVVARVGPTNITVADVEQRLRSVPDFQLATMGKSSEELRRKFLEEVLIKDALFAEEAKRRKLDESPAARERIDQLLRSARINLLKSELAITPEEIAAYYVENMGRFDTPERIAVYRILCPTREEAVRVIAEAKANGGLRRWNDLAREHSSDKATSMRGGSLGALAHDGSSSEPSVRADPALFAAASRVKDGEIVGDPVPEGTSFAVIWRRGSVPAVHRTIEEEASAIRQVLVRKKLETGLKDLLKKLRADRKVEEQPQLLDVLEVDSSGEVVQRKRPGLAPRTAAAPPAPSATPRGLR